MITKDVIAYSEENIMIGIINFFKKTFRIKSKENYQ